MATKFEYSKSSEKNKKSKIKKGYMQSKGRVVLLFIESMESCMQLVKVLTRYEKEICLSSNF